MAKKINAFKNMCQEDQVALLKGGCTEMMILRSAMNFDPTKQTWKVNESKIKNLLLQIVYLIADSAWRRRFRLECGCFETSQR